MATGEEEQKPEFIVELFLDDGRYLIVATDDIEIVEAEE